MNSHHQWNFKQGAFLYHQHLSPGLPSIKPDKSHPPAFPKHLSLNPNTLVKSIKTCSVSALLRPESVFPSCSLDGWDSRKEILFSRLNVQFYTFPLSCFSSVIWKSLKCSSCLSALSWRFSLICATCYFKCHISHCGYKLISLVSDFLPSREGKGLTRPKKCIQSKGAVKCKTLL